MGESKPTAVQLQALALIAGSESGVATRDLHKATLRALAGAGLARIDGGRAVATALASEVLLHGGVQPTPRSGEIRAYAAGDGCISFTRVAPAQQDGPGVSKGDLVSVGGPVSAAELTPTVVVRALRGESPQDYLVHEQAGSVKLVPRVTRVGADRLMFKGAEYRYAGWGAAFAAFVVEDGCEVEDQSGNRNVLSGFVEMEPALVMAVPLASVLQA